jgi:hypothetical protein
VQLGAGRVPEWFTVRAGQVWGEPGRRWAARLPTVVEDCARRWSLTVGPAFPLSYTYVAPVTRADGSPAVLKLVVPEEPELASGAEALRLAAGDGLAELFEVDLEAGALLLERVEPGDRLAALAAEDDEAATAAVLDVMHRIHRPVAGPATGAETGMHSRPPGPAHAPAGRYGDAGPEVKLFADGGDRCAIRLPSSAVTDLIAGAVGEAWRMRATGPLREALRRKLVLRPRHLQLPYLRYTDTELAGQVAGYAAAGIRLRIHALGNLAGQQTARTLRDLGVPPDAATIDHLILLDPATADLVAATRATVSYQPGFLPGYGDMIAGTRMDRRLTVLGGRLLLRAGVPLAISSDHPPGPLDPLHNLPAAVNRRLPGGRVLQPDQALTPSEAVRAHTVTAAASLGAPGSGGLTPGQPADLAICDGDPLQPDTRVVQTWLAGRPVWPTTDQPTGHPT